MPLTPREAAKRSTIVLFPTPMAERIIMKVIKQTADYTIYQKGSGRYAAKGAGGKWINGDDKVRILTTEGLVTPSAAKAASPEEDDTAAEASPAEA